MRASRICCAGWTWRGDAGRLSRATPPARPAQGRAVLAAGGLSSDHEPITAREVLDRARQGIAVMLRESSLRPDLSDLLNALKDAPGLTARAMLTADGSMPAFVLEHGFVDHLIRTAMQRGVPPLDAYR